MMGARSLSQLLLLHWAAAQLTVNRHFRGDIVTYQGQSVGQRGERASDNGILLKLIMISTNYVSTFHFN